MQNGRIDAASFLEISPLSQNSASIAAPVGNPAKEPIKKAEKPHGLSPTVIKNVFKGKTEIRSANPVLTRSLEQTENSANDGKMEYEKTEREFLTVSIVRSGIKTE